MAELKVYKEKVVWSVALGVNKTWLFQRGNDKQLCVSSFITQWPNSLTIFPSFTSNEENNVSDLEIKEM